MAIVGIDEGDVYGGDRFTPVEALHKEPAGQALLGVGQSSARRTGLVIYWADPANGDDLCPPR
ncbi:MAG: hypothetical protein GY778_20310 [bacterium]|nr:hypothetical protein [bacterium]